MSIVKLVTEQNLTNAYPVKVADTWINRLISVYNNVILDISRMKQQEFVKVLHVLKVSTKEMILSVMPVNKTAIVVIHKMTAKFVITSKLDQNLQTITFLTITVIMSVQ